MYKRIRTSLLQTRHRMIHFQLSMVTLSIHIQAMIHHCMADRLSMHTGLAHEVCVVMTNLFTTLLLLEVRGRHCFVVCVWLQKLLPPLPFRAFAMAWCVLRIPARVRVLHNFPLEWTVMMRVL